MEIIKDGEKNMEKTGYIYEKSEWDDGGVGKAIQKLLKKWGKNAQEKWIWAGNTGKLLDQKQRG